MIIGSRISKVKKESKTALNGARRESMGLNIISIPIGAVTFSELLNLSVPRFLRVPTCEVVGIHRVYLLQHFYYMHSA